MRWLLVLLVIVVTGCKTTHRPCEAYDGKKITKKK